MVKWGRKVAKIAELNQDIIDPRAYCNYKGLKRLIKKVNLHEESTVQRYFDAFDAEVFRVQKYLERAVRGDLKYEEAIMKKEVNAHRRRSKTHLMGGLDLRKLVDAEVEALHVEELTARSMSRSMHRTPKSPVPEGAGETPGAGDTGALSASPPVASSPGVVGTPTPDAKPAAADEGEVEAVDVMSDRVAEALKTYVFINKEAFRKSLKKYDKRHKTQNRHRYITAMAALSDPMTELESLLGAMLPMGGALPIILGGKGLEKKPKVEGPFYKRHRNSLIVCAISLVIIIVAISVGATVKPDRVAAAFYIGLLAAFGLAWANGGNGIANSVGTAVGAKAISLKKAVALGCVFEFLGAVTMGQLVSKTISKGVIEPDDYSEEPDLYALAMLAVLIGAASTTLLATAFGFPISATHGVVGGLVSVGMAAQGPGSLGWEALASTVVGWVLSPVAGAVTAALMHWIISSAVFNRPDADVISERAQPIFVTLTVTISAAFITVKGPDGIKIEPPLLALGIALGFGILCGIATYAYRRFKNRNRKVVPLATVHVEASDAGDAAHQKDVGTDSKPTPGSDVPHASPSPGPGSSSASSDALPKRQSKSGGLEAKADGGEAKVGGGEDKAGDGGDSDDDVFGNGGSDSDDSDTPKMSEEAREKLRQALVRAEKPFIPLLLGSAMTVAFAHGGNDVANAIGPLSSIFAVFQDGEVTGSPDIPMWALVMGASGFVFGIITMGYKTISTVGSKITTLTASKSYATQVGAGVAVLGSSALGLPVSTSHCLVGSVVGIGFAQKLQGAHGPINVKVLKRIVIGWAVTIPLAMAVTCVAFYCLLPAYN